MWTFDCSERRKWALHSQVPGRNIWDSQFFDIISFIHNNKIVRRQSLRSRIKLSFYITINNSNPSPRINLCDPWWDLTINQQYDTNKNRHISALSPINFLSEVRLVHAGRFLLERILIQSRSVRKWNFVVSTALRHTWADPKWFSWQLWLWLHP